jgi:aminopeptidase-like protein
MPLNKINVVLNDLFPINRSLTGPGVRETLQYIKANLLPHSQIKSIASGTKVFDWEVPPEWSVKEAYVKNKNGKKIIDIAENNIHLMSYSEPVETTLSEQELINHLHTLPEHPSWIPYRTSYYSRKWAFCCSHELVKSDDFIQPFEVKIDSKLNENGELNWLECYKRGEVEDEILLSSYCCHPSLANDNLSGFVAASFIFEYLQNIKTKYSYRLVIVPETIGSIAFLSQADVSKIAGGMILSCVAGPGKVSIKEGFDRTHWINKAAHYALQEKTNGEYITYPFIPDGSDERQYSSPGFRIVTPSIHKSKYYEYPEYHTSADNLEFISVANLEVTLDIYKKWIENIESYCFPKRLNEFCEYQLGKRGLYPNVGGTVSQQAHSENKHGYHSRKFNLGDEFNVTGQHLEAFNWLMHLADGRHSNFDIAEKSKLELTIINEAIDAFCQKNLIRI